MRRIRVRKVVLRSLAAVVLSVSAWVGLRAWTGNLGAVVEGRVYRAGQMDAGRLARTVRSYGIRTVLNLRGTNPGLSWYRREKEAVLAAGATLIDLPLASDQWLSHAQAGNLVEVLDHCEYPVLIHCQWGAERTGLVSAVSELLRPDASIEDARKQFSLYYLFLPVGDGKVMLAHLDRYEAWLRSRRREHSPEQFRLWIGREYQPGRPSREWWPYDPYPLRVVNRPDSPVTR